MGDVTVRRGKLVRTHEVSGALWERAICVPSRGLAVGLQKIATARQRGIYEVGLRLSVMNIGNDVRFFPMPASASPTRRQFLSTAVPFIVSAATLGRAGAVSPNEKVLACLLGKGRAVGRFVGWWAC